MHVSYVLCHDALVGFAWLCAFFAITFTTAIRLSAISFGLLIGADFGIALAFVLVFVFVAADKPGWVCLLCLKGPNIFAKVTSKLLECVFWNGHHILGNIWVGMGLLRCLKKANIIVRVISFVWKYEFRRRHYKVIYYGSRCEQFPIHPRKLQSFRT